MQTTSNLSRIIPGKPFFRSLFQSQHQWQASSQFLNSPSSRTVNPQRRKNISDTVRQTLTADENKGLTDENILALFTSGFFSGFVFGFERLFLRLGGWRVLPVKFAGLNESSSTRHIWRACQVSDARLHATGTRFFGAFQLLDKQIEKNPQQGSSYADYGFGSDLVSFAGCHRFRVTRLLLPDKPDENSQVEISLEGFTCNPLGAPSGCTMSMLKWFHYFYTRLLFANGIQAVCQHGR